MSSGPTLSEARRRELGTAQLKLRLPLCVIRELRSQAERQGLTVSELVATLAWLAEQDAARVAEWRATAEERHAADTSRELALTEAARDG